MSTLSVQKIKKQTNNCGMKSDQIEKLKKAWRNRGEILQGVSNSIWITQEVEAIAHERDQICRSNECGCYDPSGEGCDVPALKPCCSNLTGGCGCSLHLKTRSLSSACPLGYWKAIMSEEEENQIP